MSVTITPKLQQLINHLKSEVPDVLDITLEPVPSEWLKDVDCVGWIVKTLDEPNNEIELSVNSTGLPSILLTNLVSNVKYRGLNV